MFSTKVSISPRRWLFLPIEIAVREVDGSALLALQAVERGWGVILGDRAIRSSPNLPRRGVQLERWVGPGMLRKVQPALEKERSLAAWCEEGLIYPNAEEYGRRKIDPSMFEKVNVFFAWGQNQADDLKTLGYDPAKIEVSGNPRFDVYRPELRDIFADHVARLRQRHGRFILVNTAFGVFNHQYISVERAVAKMRRAGRVTNDVDEAHYRDWAAFKGRGYHAFLDLVPRLSEQYPGVNIVLRPHPSEKIEPWIAAANGLPNVTVTREGSVAAWILASTACIQHNCTSGVEAFLLDKPSIAYRPVTDPLFDQRLSNDLSIGAFDLVELFENIDRALADEDVATTANVEKQKRIARHFIANFDGRAATDRILDALDALDAPEEAFDFRPTRWFVRPLVRAIARFKAGSAPEGKRPSTQFRFNELDPLTLGYLSDMIGAIGRVTGNVADVRVRELGHRVFCVYRS